MFYHISERESLTELEPRISTHGKAWVYALKDPSLGLVFAGRDSFNMKADDSYFSCRATSSTAPEIFELYNGCFEEIFKNKDCYIYQLEDSGFMSGQTSLQVEWVSPNKTKIVGKTYVPDILKALEDLEKVGKIVIHRYENTKEYNAFVEDRIKAYLSNYCNSGSFSIHLVKHYPEIVQKYVNDKMSKIVPPNSTYCSKEELQQKFAELDKGADKGLHIRQAPIYFYPQETRAWIDRKYQTLSQNKSKQKELSK